MELKTNKRVVNKCDAVFSKNIEMPIESELMVDSVKPAVSSVLKIKGEPLVSCADISGQTMKIEGTLLVTVICSDENSMPFSVNYTVPITKTIELDKNFEGTITTQPTLSYLNCRAVSGRRMEIKGAVSVKTEITQNTETEVLCGCEDKHIKCKTETLEYNLTESIANKNIIIEEELLLSENDTMCSILRYCATPKVDECKYVSGKAVIKGTLLVKIISCGEKGNINEFSDELPFTQILESKTEIENCDCSASATLSYLEIKPRTGSDGSFSSVILTARVSISVNNVSYDSFEYVKDLYSTGYETNCEHIKLCLKKKVGTLRDEFTCRKELEFTEGSLNRILDIWCEINESNSAIEGNILVADATVRICILGCDVQGRAVYFERPVDCRYQYEIKADNKFSECSPKFFVDKISYSQIDNNVIEAAVSLQVVSDMYDVILVEPVSKVVCNEYIEQRNNGTLMYVYAGEIGENLWDIAKKYKSDENKIRVLNKLETQTLIKNTKIIIPV